MLAHLRSVSQITPSDEPTLLLIGGSPAARQLLLHRLHTVGVQCKSAPELQPLETSTPSPDPWEAFQVIANRLRSLTKKESVVLESVLEGLTNKTISIRLDLTERAIELRKASLMKKLGVRCHTELIRLIAQFQTIQQYYFRYSMSPIHHQNGLHSLPAKDTSDHRDAVRTPNDFE